MNDVATLTDPARAELLLHPLRRRIMEAAAEGPVSATEVARRTGETRQKVNYHLRSLADAGLLEPAGERPRRGLTEKLYRTSAASYTLSPEVLGTLGPRVEDLGDAFSAGTLLALATRTHREVANAWAQAERAGKRLATLSLDTEVHFRSARQQADFARALTQAVADVASRFSQPADAADSSLHRYRVVLGAYPVPADTSDDPGTHDHLEDAS